MWVGGGGEGGREGGGLIRDGRLFEGCAFSSPEGALIRCITVHENNIPNKNSKTMESW